jgi:hypothetical protein
VVGIWRIRYKLKHLGNGKGGSGLGFGRKVKTEKERAVLHLQDEDLSSGTNIQGQIPVMITVSDYRGNMQYAIKVRQSKRYGTSNINQANSLVTLTM